jgi:hypothetical protein
MVAASRTLPVVAAAGVVALCIAASSVSLQLFQDAGSAQLVAVVGAGGGSTRTPAPASSRCDDVDAVRSMLATPLCEYANNEDEWDEPAKLARSCVPDVETQTLDEDSAVLPYATDEIRGESWQTRWDVAGDALVTSEGIRLPCTAIYTIHVDTTLSPKHCTMATDADDTIDVRSGSVATRVCEADVLALLPAWHAAERSEATGYRQRVPSLIKLLVPSPFTTMYIAGVPWPLSTTPESVIYRLHNAAISQHGVVYTSTMVIKPQVHWDAFTVLNKRPLVPKRHVKRALALAMQWSDSLQHFVFDTLPKVNLATDLVRRFKGEIVVCHIGGHAGAHGLLPVRVID